MHRRLPSKCMQWYRAKSSGLVSTTSTILAMSARNLEDLMGVSNVRLQLDTKWLLQFDNKKWKELLPQRVPLPNKQGKDSGYRSDGWSKGHQEHHWQKTSWSCAGRSCHELFDVSEISSCCSCWYLLWHKFCHVALLTLFLLLLYAHVSIYVEADLLSCNHIVEQHYLQSWILNIDKRWQDFTRRQRQTG